MLRLALMLFVLLLLDRARLFVLFTLCPCLIQHTCICTAGPCRNELMRCNAINGMTYHTHIYTKRRWGPMKGVQCLFNLFRCACHIKTVAISYKYIYMDYVCTMCGNAATAATALALAPFTTP